MVSSTRTISYGKVYIVFWMFVFMKFYLSSYKLGNKSEEIKGLMPTGKKMGYIPNALDFSGASADRRKTSIGKDISGLEELGLDVELLDLKRYFGKADELKIKLDELGGVFVRGGNVFVLRQAMKISGFDKIFKAMRNREDFLYSGFSAGVCVLAPNLDSLQIVDDAKDMPYSELKEVSFEGLGILDYLILPHYKSDHPESLDIDKAFEYCEDNSIRNKPLKDGQVLILKK